MLRAGHTGQPDEGATGVAMGQISQRLSVTSKYPSSKKLSEGNSQGVARG